MFRLSRPRDRASGLLLQSPDTVLSGRALIAMIRDAPVFDVGDEAGFFQSVIVAELY